MSTSAFGPVRQSSGRPSVNAVKLWAGGVATAAVAALVVVVGVLIVRGILNIPILAPDEAGSYGNVTTTTFALAVALAALLATGLLHVLLLAFPSPTVFFGWIAGLVTVAAALVPFTRGAPLETKIASSAIILVAGVCIISLLNSIAWSAIRPQRPERPERPEQRGRPEPPEPPYYPRYPER